MNKEKIQKAALKLFARKGYYGCSMQDIADAVKLTKATLYFYFKSKEELYLLILKEEFGVYRHTLVKSIQEHLGDPLETLLFEVLKIFIQNTKKNDLLIWKSTRLMAIGDDTGLGAAAREIVTDSQKQLYKIFDSMIIEKKPGGSRARFRKFLRSYLLFLESVLDWRMMQPFGLKQDKDPRILKELWDNFWLGSGFKEEDL
jgi:AcrR family transcriptional regulator